jgi:hypothetical protein
MPCRELFVLCGMTDTLTPAQRRTVRHLKVRALRRKGMTQAAIAAQVGMSQQRVGQLLQINPVMAPKPCKKGKQTVFGSGTDPAKAAERIREVFGDAFAEALGEQLRVNSDSICWWFDPANEWVPSVCIEPLGAEVDLHPQPFIASDPNGA